MTRLEENIGGANITLSDDDLANINKALDNIAFGENAIPQAWQTCKGGKQQVILPVIRSPCQVCYEQVTRKR